MPHVMKNSTLEENIEHGLQLRSKDRSFKCKVCGETFRDGDDFQKHVLIHIGEKSHRC